MTAYGNRNIDVYNGWYVQQSNDPVEKDEVIQNRDLVQIRCHGALSGSSKAPDSYQIDLDYRS